MKSKDHHEPRLTLAQKPLQLAENSEESLLTNPKPHHQAPGSGHGAIPGTLSTLMKGSGDY